MSNDLNTTILQGLVHRIQEDDPTLREDAANELLRACLDRLVVVARKMLRQFFSTSRPLEDTLDVLQVASLRLLTALHTVVPENTHHFYALAAQNIRWVLLDLLRQYRNRPQPLSITGKDSTKPDLQLASPEADLAELDRWQAFHEAAESLTGDEREVFNLHFYQGFPYVQIGTLLHIDESTARQRYRRACRRMRDQLGGDTPSF